MVTVPYEREFTAHKNKQDIMATRATKNVRVHVITP